MPEFEGRVNCIYIDPPYNTGNEGWVYNDNVNDPRIKKWLGDVVGKEGEDLTRHDKWLCMMYPRLKLLHQLLAEDGVIFISIDDNEQANLKLICDEVFGGSNFIVNIVWEKKSSPQNDARWVSDTHDFVICYAKNLSKLSLNRLKRTVEQNSIYKNSDEYDGVDEDGNVYGRGVWFAGDMTVKTVNDKALYGIETPSGRVVYPAKGRAWVYFKDKFEELCADNRITFGVNGSNKPCIKRFLSEIEELGVVPKSNWSYKEVGENRNARQELKNIFQEINPPFDTPKPASLIERILQMSTNKNSIILDSFAGSGTTAHAVLKLNAQDGGNRRFILCEMMDYADTITAERVRRVMTGYGEDNKQVAGLGGAFDYYTLGEPLFNGDYLNEIVGAAKIRQYVAYSENIPLAQRCESSPVSPYLLGLNTDTSWIFYYEPERETVLDAEFLGTLKYRANGFTVPAHSIIYADTCVLTKAQLERFGLRFKKIPRDITRL